jgi:creatinine amidohydrolase
MTTPPSLTLDELTTTLLNEALSKGDVVALLPLGSVEPHGPHLPLSTDRLLSEESARLATDALRARGVSTWVAPPLAYGVTEFARGFCGAISISHPLMTQLIIEIVEGYLSAGFAHVCLINHHLEPGQLAAIVEARATLIESHGPKAVSAPSVVTRRWGRLLGDEFRSGACHAGAYEGSMIRRSHPQLFHEEVADALPKLEISLSDAIKEGRGGFLDIGMDRAYTGAPAQATPEEGARLYECHAEMICQEVLEHLGRSTR